MSEVVSAPRDDWLCPITHSLMRDPVVAADGQTYERLAIERWFAQRQTSPLTGETLASSALTPAAPLQKDIRDYAEANRTSPDGEAYFACAYCHEPSCCSRAQCKAKYERQLRTDAAFGAAARRRRWIEGTVLPSAERVLRSGPVSAGALMVGAFSVGAVGALLGGVASSVAEVLSGGAELAHGLIDSIAFRLGAPVDDDEDRPSVQRGCFKIASGAFLVPVASASIAAVFALGAAAGSIALATGILKELAQATLHAARATSNALVAPPQETELPPTTLAITDGSSSSSS